MTKLIFITHPSVSISVDIPADEWHLSEKGREEARQLLQKPFWKEVTALYASTEPKSYETAELVHDIRPDLSVRQVQALKEIDRRSTGLLPLDEYMEVVRQFYAQPDTQVRGWESAAAARARMSQAVRDIMSKHTDETVVIVGHGATGTLLACDVQQIPSSFEQDPKRTACFMEIDWERQMLLKPWQAYGESVQEMAAEYSHKRMR